MIFFFLSESSSSNQKWLSPVYWILKYNLQWKNIYHITEVRQQNLYLGKAGLMIIHSTFNNYANYYF